MFRLLAHVALPALALTLARDAGSARVPPPARAPSDLEPRLATSTWGDGTRVVVVPGVLGTAYGFRKVIPGLVADGFRVTVVDPLGFGASPHPDGADYSFAAQALRVARAIEEDGRGKVILACHALSGPICLRLGYQRPDLVRGIVSINGGASEQAGTAQIRMALKLARFVLAITGQRFAVHKVKDGLIGASGDADWVSDSVVAKYVAPFGTDVRQVVRTMQQIVGAHDVEPLAPNLARVDAPVLLLYGPSARDQKHATPTGDERATLRAGLRSFQEEDVPGAGVYIQEEQPDRVVTAIKQMRAATSP